MAQHILLRISFAVALVACSAPRAEDVRIDGHGAGVQVDQRVGDPQRGRSLLLNNGTEEAPYLSCGIPRKLLDMLRFFGLDPFANEPKLAERERGNADLAYNFSYATAPSGIEVVTTNCLMCHAAKLGDSLIVGLGNPNLNFAAEGGGAFGLPGVALDLLALTLTEAERTELARFSRVKEAASNWARPDTVGVNPADVMFGVLASHRDPETLEWHDDVDEQARLDVDLMYTDVPAWWNLHRRDRMFYSGFGRGDHARIMMSAALICLENAEEAAAIDAYFPDIRAFIASLRAPSYETIAKRAIDRTSAARGRESFLTKCAHCHGDAEQGIDPVPAVSVDEVGTDPSYAISSSKAGGGAIAYYFDFFNRSWYGKQGAAGELVREERPVYSPPPLDGVWATAPYFHNGSVPTLDAVLDPSLRPGVFRRSTTPEDYDFERLGWPYEEVAAKGDDATIYDATRDTYRNTGHTFAAALTAEERRDLLEYLKTL